MTQKHYQGFLNTPFLWKNDGGIGLNQFQIKPKSSKINLVIDKNLRLGKYVERLVSFQLQEQKNITVLAENIQIQNNKITIGEIDCILLKNDVPIHLEIIYKFYLYDESVGDNEIDHFIGPNRKDTLKQKLEKLKEKQLPLLYSQHCKPYLKSIHVNSKNMSQQVYFKAQLFIPFFKQNIKLKQLNQDCIVGFYINKNQLQELDNCKFYIPSKKDWLITPFTNVNWLNFENFKTKAEYYFHEKVSPLCWVKFKNGELKKLFLVWW